MNFDKVPKPGAHNGPCERECEHEQCNIYARIAFSRCALCGEPIGFNCAFCHWPTEASTPRLRAHLYCAAVEADHAWDRELIRNFGVQAMNARHDQRGASTPELARLRAAMFAASEALQQANNQ